MPYTSMMDAPVQPLIAIAQVMMIDIALAGDNAIVVGLAASRVAAAMRRKVIFWGIAGAVVLRVLFAVLATRLFAVIGLPLAGGLILLLVCWKMYRDLSRGPEDQAVHPGRPPLRPPRAPVGLRPPLAAILDPT